MAKFITALESIEQKRSGLILSYTKSESEEGEYAGAKEWAAPAS